MILAEVLEDGLLTFGILVGLPIPELVCTEKRIKKALESSHGWANSAKASLPRYDLGSPIFECKSKFAFMTACAPLLDVQVAEGQRIAVDTMEEAQAIAKLARVALRNAARLIESGSTTCVSLGYFHFSSFSIELGPDIVCSAPVTVPIPEALARRMRAESSELLVTLAWGGREKALMIKGEARQRPNATRPACTHAVIGLQCVNPAFKVDHRRCLVSLNGSWHKAEDGLCWLPNRVAAARETLAGGVLCAVSIGDVEASSAPSASHQSVWLPRDQSPHVLVSALSLELPNMV
mmetsp:Transcript_73707/g.140282  ORF Transcript_73707/g.140282 Transcript_73707/m.140282 type:complete len:293 (-) Transcript_73707:56-934(-)